MSHEMLTDLYEFSMANGYYQTLPHDKQARFDVFYRNAPDEDSFVLSAGLMQIIEEVKNWHFTKEDIDYLRTLNKFSDEFLTFLKDAKNKCTINAMTEGTPLLPREPILTISGPLIEVQLLETLVLNIFGGL